MNKLLLRKIIKIGFILFILIQLVPVTRDNPSVVTAPKWDSAETEAIARRACFDCHSNETVWPWYAYIAPVSWLIARDVHEGRDHFNMSQLEGDDGWEAAEQVEIGKMPFKPYLLLHPEAKLTQQEKELLIKGLEKTFE